MVLGRWVWSVQSGRRGGRPARFSFFSVNLTVPPELPAALRVLLADVAYDAPALRAAGAAAGLALVTPRRGAYPHADPGADFRAGLRLCLRAA